MNSLSDRPPAAHSKEHAVATSGRSVRVFLIWLVLACLLPGVVGAALLFAQQYREGRARLERDILQTARALVQAVDNQIFQVEALAQGLATSGFLAEGDLARFHKQARQTLAQARLATSVVLIDRSGQQVLNTLKEFGEPLPRAGNPDNVRRVFETGKPLVSDLYIAAVLLRPIMTVTMPVFIDGRMPYVLVAPILPDRFNAILHAQALPSTWDAFILDGTGAIAAYDRAPQDLVGKKADHEFLLRYQASGQGTAEVTTRDGVRVFSAFTRSPVTGWGVRIDISGDALVASQKNRLLPLATAVLGLFTIGLGLAWLIGGKIARSFRALTAPAFALGAGNRVRLPTVDVKEAAEVSRAIGEAARLLAERDAALRRERSQLKAILDYSPALISIKDLDGRLVLANRATFELLDVPPPEQSVGRSVFELFPQEVAETSWRNDLLALTSNGSVEVEENFPHRDGTLHTYLTLKFPLLDVDTGDKSGICAISTDITERKLAEQREREAALHDPLTGLPNRALVFEYVGHLLAGASRNHGRGALLFIDLDRFKPINDVYGHEAGDQVLQEVARRLVACTRQEDLVGRLGGDEFVIVLPNLEAEHHRAAAVARHVLDRLEQPFRINRLELSLSSSIGISYYPVHATDIETLIHAADLAMYQAKQSGKAHFRFYTPALNQRASEACALETTLKNALRQGGALTLYYQPVLDIRDGRLCGVEALVRLRDGNGNPIGPERFIPVAESAGLSGELGQWVATEACRQHGEWLNEGLRVSIAINVSPLQFRQQDFAEKLGHIISDAGVDPSCLQLEVTESAVMEDLDNAVAILDRIKSLGVKVALDDFGTGYSSLSRLSSLPLDTLKVDQSFVRRIESDQASRAVAEAIVALGRSLKLEVIGEGIESEGALRYLQTLGCNRAQGFWFSRPLPASELTEWCRRHDAIQG
jgi:diguanylate cyclase (GGDEF)-like protein/PAS domain S-box-containing protein